MSKPKRYRPSRDGLAIPMPDRGNRLMPMIGVVIDPGQPYYRQLLADGDIVEVRNARPAPSRRSKRNRK